jgi:glycosyltransferase involved in cell wall biosynthesis
MRILIATTHRAVIGGTETYLSQLLPGLVERGHELALLYDVPAQNGRAAIDDDCPRIPAWSYGGAGIDAAADWRPDVCYLQGMLHPDSEEAVVANFPTVLFAHNYYGTCATGTKRHRWPTLAPCSRKFGPACLGLNYLRGCGARHPLRLLDGYRDQRRRILLLPKVKAVLVASRHMADEYRRNGVSPGLVRIAPYPVAATPLPEEPPRRPMTGRILMASRFTDLKGGHLLLAAVKEASRRLRRELSVLLAGEGPERVRWEALAAELGTQARFLGWCNSSRLRELQSGADLLAVPSIWPEPFGLVGIEAGCVGLPAVGFAVGGIPDWLIPGRSGELASVPPTAGGLADAVVRALADLDHYHRLRVGAWEVARQFTLTRHLGIVEVILARAGERPRAGPSI